MCVDYRDNNNQTENDAYIFPRINKFWPFLSKARCFASFDLFKGYHQVKFDRNDRYKMLLLTH